MSSRDGEPEDLIRASGCLVYRAAEGRQDGVAVEVLVVHRPHYDDWDFPKGKLEPGETDLECALRETEEETGYVGEIGNELPSDRYQVKGRPKLVRWWLLRQTGGSFSANDEVDEVRWLSPAEASTRLSYDHAIGLLDLVPPSAPPSGPDRPAGRP